jgi:serine/threonine-protein kinase
LSPDGKRLAFVVGHEPGRFGIWVHDIERNTTSPLTSLPGLNDAPVWTPDGRHIVFLSRNQPNPGTYWMPADGSGDAQRLMDGEIAQPVGSFSPDGRLAYSQLRGSGQTEIWTVPVEGDSDHPRLGKADFFLRASGIQKPAFSPDGRWLAYQASEGGSPEVYVRAFPGPAGKWPISSGGGRYPMWSRSASGVTGELFYLAPDDRIMAVTYTTTGDGFSPGKPRVWSEKKVAHVTVGNTYALAPDGKRCAVVLDAGGSTEEQRATDSVTVLLNFFDELRRHVPAGEK